MPSAAWQSINSEKLVRTCSIWRALEVLGDVPTLLILESIWLGDLRFEQIKARTGLSKPLLADRLKKLIADGVLERQLYCEKPPRYDYRLTAKGRELFPVTMMLLRWETQWSPRRGTLQMDLLHTGCGKVASPQPMCGSCHRSVRPQDIAWHKGPGTSMMEPSYTRRRHYRSRQTVGQDLSLFTDSADLLGDRWAGLIMRAVFTGLHKFDEILEDSGIASNILTDRLAWLVERGFLVTSLYQSSPNRFAYRPTPRALGYLPVLLVLQRWGDAYYGSEAGPPVILTHRTCGKPLDLQAGCGNCGEELQLPDVTLQHKFTPIGGKPA